MCILSQNCWNPFIWYSILKKQYIWRIHAENECIYHACLKKVFFLLLSENEVSAAQPPIQATYFRFLVKVPLLSIWLQVSSQVCLILMSWWNCSAIQYIVEVCNKYKCLLNFYPVFGILIQQFECTRYYTFCR